ncbi:sensor histidine kinase [Gordonia phosphorivorans]|uniref:Sensor histidine kinase n=1 Tax=Gordonia phosphorivorans TaxID=1056982 RepID=A0ABV6H7G0_9ACTN
MVTDDKRDRRLSRRDRRDGEMTVAAVRPPVSVGSTETDRLLTMMTRFVAAGFAVYFLIALPVLDEPAGMVASWFPAVAAFLAFGPAVLVLASTWRARAARLIPVLVYLSAVGYLAACGLWYLAWNGESTSAEQVSWLINFAGLPALAVALHRLRDALVVLVLCSALRAALIVSGRGAGPEVFAQEALWSIVFTIPFVVAIRMVMRIGRLLDQTRAEAIQVAAEAAGAAARNSERSRFDALIHDQVIATLLAANDRHPDHRLAEQARSALHELAVIADGPDSAHEVLSIAETVARLRTMATSIEADVPLGVVNKDGLDEAAARYPEYAIRAIAEAMGEAMRNSVMHAGPEAERAALVEVEAESILLTVADNGVGFEVADVPPERLGIEVSIRARLEDTPGGSVALSSAPGRGTTVRLRWDGRS